MDYRPDKDLYRIKAGIRRKCYNDIEDLTNASTAWKFLEANFKPQGSGFLNASIEKLLFLFLTDCKDAANYITRFRVVVNELKSFSNKLQLDKNLWIFYYSTISLASTLATVKITDKSMIRLHKMDLLNIHSALQCTISR